MIRLRVAIERGLRHPVLGPLLVIVLAVMLVMVIFHTTNDQLHKAGLLLCAAVMLLVAVVLLPPRTLVPARRSRPNRRGPPERRRAPIASGFPETAASPLRL